MDPKKFNGLHLLHSFTVDIQGGGGGFVPVKVQDELLRFWNVQRQVVKGTPLTESSDLIPVSRFILPSDQPTTVVSSL